MALPYVTSNQAKQAIAEELKPVPVQEKKYYVYTLFKEHSDYPNSIQFISGFDMRYDTVTHLYEDLLKNYGENVQLPAIGYDLNALGVDPGESMYCVYVSKTRYANKVLYQRYQCSMRNRSEMVIGDTDVTALYRTEL